MNLSALQHLIMIDFDMHVSLRKPDAMHPARRMAKVIYSMKMELLFRGNETVIKT